MSNLTFNFLLDGKEKPITCQNDDLISEPFKEFAKTLNKNLEDFAFYYKASQIFDYSQRINQSIFSNSEIKKFNILVFLLPSEESTQEETEESNRINIKESKKEETKEKNEESIKKEKPEFYNDVICPECRTSAIIDIDNDKEGYDLKILNCENFHNLRSLNYDICDQFIFEKRYNETDLSDLNPYKDLLVCGCCGDYQVKLTPPEDKYSFCYHCQNNICPSCMTVHKEEYKDHKYIPLEDKNYYCIKHGKKFDSYCIDCNCNICDECKSSHPENEHQIIAYNKINLINNDTEKLENKIKDDKAKLKDYISSMKELLDNMINEIEKYINGYIRLEKTILKRYKNGLYNFQLLRNLNNENIFNNSLFSKLESKLKEETKEKINFFRDLYTKITKIKKEKDKGQEYKPIPDNKIEIQYDIKDTKKRKVKIFDEIFVKNNKDRLEVTINNVKQKELETYYYNSKEEKILKVILTEKEKAVKDLSYMVNNIKNVTSVNFGGKYNAKNITSMEAMFQLTSFPIPKEISIFQTPNLKNIRALFCKCVGLTSIPDLNNIFYKDNNLKNISMLFNGCKKIKKINGNNWYGSKIEDMSYLFNRCSDLDEIHLGYIITNNVKNMCGLFNGCTKISKIPSVITKGYFQSLEDISIIFQDCTSLIKSIDIRAQNPTLYLKDISGMFSGCTKLTSVSLKNFTTENVKEMIGVFNNCAEMTTVTIGNWDVSKVTNASGMFYQCGKLKAVKGTDGLKFNKSANVENFFDQCSFDKKNSILKIKDN